MKLQCPACRKTNNDVSECVRCGCDISVLVDIVHAAEFEVLCSKKNLETRNVLRALHHAERSWSFKKSLHAARLAFLSCLAAQRFDEAERWCAAANTLEAINGSELEREKGLEEAINDLR